MLKAIRNFEATKGVSFHQDLYSPNECCIQKSHLGRPETHFFYCSQGSRDFFETPGQICSQEKFMKLSRKSILLHYFHTSFFSLNITKIEPTTLASTHFQLVLKTEFIIKRQESCVRICEIPGGKSPNIPCDSRSPG